MPLPLIQTRFLFFYWLCLRGGYELPFIRRVADELSRRCALIPWLAHLVSRQSQ